jgi:hypothetical protein
VIKFNAIELQNVKGFHGFFRAAFSKDSELYTVSGANGSGKSTVLRSLVLVQKAFFALQLKAGSELYQQYWPQVSEEVKRYLRDEKSYICVRFSIDGQNGHLVLQARPDCKWIMSGECLEELREFWDIENPSAIILYLDASKSVLEEEIRYTNLSMSDDGRETLAIRCIFAPQFAFSEMYRQTIQDYILERLSPSTPPRTLYQSMAKNVFRGLLGGIEISRFSSRLDQQVTLLARRVAPKKSAPFDIRELSSGEKTLYFTLSYLFLANTVGCLIIDEPENHFHEDLLVKFVTFLDSVTAAGNLTSYLQNLTSFDDEDLGVAGNGSTSEAKKNKSKLAFEKIYAKHRISQIFLLTHSKTLIYHVFSMGTNYAIRHLGKDAKWEAIAEISAESTIRELGLSATLHRILFVEGKGDSSLLAKTLAAKNVVVRPLDGSSAVKEMFRRLSSIKAEVKGIAFGFLIDGDDKPASYIESLRAVDPDFFAQCFYVLSRHEIENYLLDEAVFLKAIEEERAQSVPPPPLTEQQIRVALVEFGKKAINSSFKKAVNARLEMAVTSLLAPKLWGNKNLRYENSEKLNEALSSLSISTIGQDVLDAVQQTVNTSTAHFFDISDEEVLARCDGKQVLSMAADHFAKYCGVTKDRFLQRLYANSLNDESTKIGIVVKDLKAIFPD